MVQNVNNTAITGPTTAMLVTRWSSSKNNDSTSSINNDGNTSINNNGNTSVNSKKKKVLAKKA